MKRLLDQTVQNRRDAQSARPLATGLRDIHHQHRRGLIPRFKINTRLAKGPAKAEEVCAYLREAF